MILHTVPSWLRVFAERLSEVLLVVDERPSSGRIAQQHRKVFENEQLYDALDDLVKVDSRIKYRVLDYGAVQKTGQKWFQESNILRCQSGTPIFAFAQAIEEASGDIVLRTDADMLFYDDGWVDKAISILQCKEIDVVEPPKLGMDLHPSYRLISTRAFLVKPSEFVSNCLPLKAHRLDFARRLHRFLNGRSPWLALEEIFEKEKKNKRIRHTLLGPELGFSVHVYNRADAHLESFEKVVSLIESNRIPSEQISQGWNLVLEAWA
jgi:glycosyltransferase involved in cell wall biosynthesis